MKHLIAIISAVLQLIYVATLLESISTAIKLFQIESLYGPMDPRMMAGGLSEILVGLAVGVMIGLAGVVLAWRVLRDAEHRPKWFVGASAFFAWAWMVFIPIGTVVGILMLRWRRTESPLQPELPSNDAA